MITIDEMNLLLDAIVDDLPQELFEQLNGGIYLLPEAKLSPAALADDLYILGEYNHHYPQGRYINIYYGSFAKLGLSDTALQERLRKVVLHELTHHLEGLAGERGLEYEDQLEIDEYRSRHREDDALA